MRLEHAFEVPASLDEAWALLVDIPRVVPCMPGATLVDTIDDATWKAKLQVKLGPIALTFDTDVHRTALDIEGRRMDLAASGREVRGRGRAEGTLHVSLEAIPSGTQVTMVTEVLLAGAVASYGSGMVREISNQLVGSFAECLRAQMAADSGDAEAADTARAAVARQSRPLSGASLAKAAIGGLVRRRNE